MKAVLIIIALLITIAALAGWISFSDRGDTARIELNKQEAMDETQNAVESISEAVEDAVEGIERQFHSDHNPPKSGEESTQTIVR